MASKVIEMRTLHIEEENAHWQHTRGYAGRSKYTNNNTSKRSLCEIFVKSTYKCRSERCRSVLFNIILEVLDTSKSSIPVL